jgi:hypothetical protein
MNKKSPKTLCKFSFKSRSKRKKLHQTKSKIQTVKIVKERKTISKMRSIVVLCFFALVAAAAAVVIPTKETTSGKIDVFVNAAALDDAVTEKRTDIKAACDLGSCARWCNDRAWANGFRCWTAWCDGGYCNCYQHNNC